MNIEDVKRFLASQAYGEVPRPGGAYGARPFITISRQTGAGGRSLAEAVLKAMGTRKDDELLRGWRVFDRELCELVASDPALKVPFDALLTEEFLTELRDYADQLVAGRTAQAKVMRSVFRVVRGLASLGKTIIVGRGACCLTRELPGVHLRLIAPRRTRIERMARLLGEARDRAEKHVDAQDASRARLVRTYFGKDIEDPLLYDAVWNTESVALETIASAVVEMVRDKAAALAAAEPAVR